MMATMRLGLTGKSVALTGGSPGIGRACARALVTTGARLAVTADCAVMSGPFGVSGVNNVTGGA